MALNLAHGTNSTTGAPVKTVRSGLASFKRIWEDIEREDAERISQQKPSSQQVPFSQDDKPFDGWDPSPERPSNQRPASNGKMSTADFWSELESRGSKLGTNVARAKQVKAEFDAKSSKVAAKRKRIDEPQPSAPSRPVKRKSDLIELSDSEHEPATKRRQPVPASTTASISSKATTSKVKPWDQDYSKKKLKPESEGPVAKKTKPKAAEIISLSPQQQGILDVVMQGKTVFFTGSAGTGKSVLLRSIIKSLRAKYVKSPDAIAVTASTGIAACNIGGVTLHSFSGIGLGAEKPAELATKVRRNPKATNRWQRVKVLIIDEISMLEGDLLDKLEQLARILRKSSKPFAGIQLVLTGDFFQLPPVTRGVVKFAFQAECWETCIEKKFNLTRVFRQKDQDFVSMLNEMRLGKLSQKSIQVFSSRYRPLPADGIEPTELFPRREDVDRANREQLEKLEGDMITYQALDGGVADERSRETMLNNFMAPKSVSLKVNAQVMMIKNIDEQLVNGTVGKVIDFMTEAEWQESHMMRGAQFEENPEEKEKEKEKPRKQAGKKLPVVEWKIVGSKNHRVDLVMEETFKVEGADGRVEASRTQLPLILAWAMSIHKSQGQTLEKVKIDLRKVFEKGQAYVAISRATSLEGLQIIGFSASKVYAHPAVSEWIKTLITDD